MMCALFVVSIIAAFLAGIVVGGIGIILAERNPSMDDKPPVLEDP